MVLPARSAVPQTPDRQPAVYYQAGQGNILSHFAGMATPNGSQENVTMEQAKSSSTDVKLRMRHGSQARMGFNTRLDAAASSLVSSSTSTATAAALSPVDNNNRSSQQPANVLAEGADDDHVMEDASHASIPRGNGKMPRELELSLWKLGQAQRKPTPKTSARVNRSKSIRRGAGNGDANGNSGGVMGRPIASSSEMAANNTSSNSDLHNANDNQNDASGAGASMFSMHISPPRHKSSSAVSSRRSTMEVDHINAPTQEPRQDASLLGSSSSRGLGDSLMKGDGPPSSGSFSLQAAMAFLSRDLVEEERANKTKSAAERAFLYKKRYLDAYALASGLCENLFELERASQLRGSRTNNASSSSSHLQGSSSNADEKRMASLCREVDALSKELRDRDSMIASLHNDQQESARALHELKTSQNGSSMQESDARLQAAHVAQLEDQVARLQRENTASEAQVIEMSAKMSDMQHQLDAAHAERVQIQASMHQTEQHLESVHTQWLKEKSDLLESTDDTKKKLSSECEKLRRENAQLKKAVQQSNDTERQLRASAQGFQQTLDEAKQYVTVLNNQLQEANAHIASFAETKAQLVALRGELERTQQTLDAATNENGYLRRELSNAHAHAEQMKSEFRERMQQLERRIYQAEIVRRSLHNKVMELKGNIRVFCRVRPVLRQEAGGNGNEEIFSFPDYNGERRQIELMAGPRSHVGYGQNGGRETVKKYPFDFDLVFNGACSQEDVFLEVSALIQSALDGFNVCIFAYGQTGSGKTYTMQGISDYDGMEPSPHTGIVGRAISHIYATIDDLRSSGWDFSVSLEMIEIYNETLRDLLAPAGVQSPDKVDLRLDSDGKPMVANSCVHTIEDEHAAWHLLETAMGRRATKSTNMNDHSSRSHCVISFRLNGVNSLTGDRRSSVVHLVDLAGSERLSKSGSGNDRELLKETQCINKSLSSLGNVICALAKKSAHVPFRDSKLTHFLSPSLGGDSKTLMICNLSPLRQHRDETLNSLRFAKTVNSCEIAFPSYASRA